MQRHALLLVMMVLIVVFASAGFAQSIFAAATTIGTNISTTGNLTVSGTASFPITKGHFLIGNDAGITQATSTIFISSTGGIWMKNPANGIGQMTTGPHANVLFMIGDGTATDLVNSAAATTAYAFYMAPTIQISNSSLTNVVEGLRANIKVSDDGTARTVTDLSSVRIGAPTKSANITATNAYGLYVENPTIGGTLNEGIHNAGILHQVGAATFDSTLTGGASSNISLGTNPASGGIINIPNTAGMWARNAANDNNLILIQSTAANKTSLPNPNGVSITASLSFGTNSAADGTIKFPTAGSIFWRNAANDHDAAQITTDSGNNLLFRTGGVGYTDAMMISSGGKIGIGTTTPVAQLQVANSTANATTTMEVGKANQNKGSCLKLYRTDGSAIYAYVAADATTFTLTTTACASVTGF